MARPAHSDYEVIVIGAGFSGLAAALRLAQFGKRVLVLESHNLPGGLNSYYFRPPKAAIFNSGLHTLTNYRADNPRWGRGLLCRTLGLAREEMDLRPPQFPAVVLTPRLRFEFAGGYDSFRERMHAQFRVTPAEWQRFEDAVLAATAGPGGPPSAADEVVAAHLADPLLREAVRLPVYLYGGYREGSLDWRTFALIFRSLIMDGFCSAPNIKVLLDCFVRHLKELGGELALRTPVARILRENGAARGVVTDRGDVIRAARIISSAGLPETLALAGEPAPPAGAPAISAFETTLEFTAPVAAQGAAFSLMFVSRQEEFHWTMPAGWDGVHHLTLSVADAYAGLAATAPHHLKIGSYLHGRHWLGLDEETYRARKAQFEQRLLAELRALAPGVEPAAARRIESLTPATVVRYTGHREGAIYGVAAKAFDGATPVPGLSLCGNDQGGIGVMGAAISGILAANQVLLRPAP